MKFLDGFVNFAARLGLGGNKMFSGGHYSFDNFTRNTAELEAAYRTNWITGQIVDVVAEDMTREGIDIGSGFEADEKSRVTLALQRLQIFDALCETIKWSRLYGGAIAVLLIDGQDFSQPLDVSAIGPGRFRGLYVLDRSQVSPSTRLVTEYGPEYGNPEFYRVTGADTQGQDGSIAGANIHYSRVLRFVGVPLPYRQRVTEDGWGMSVIERLRDRLTAYDQSTQGAAQLVLKAHLRTYSVEGLRELIAAGGPAFNALIEQLSLIRDFQSSEGLTLIDKSDTLQFDSYTFGGLADILAEFGQQLSGATGIPLVRLFGQSPRGFSTGETDLRNYYDMIRAKQAKDLDDAVRRVLAVAAVSVLSKPLPETFSFTFAPLWQLSEKEKSEIASADATRVATLVTADVYNRAQALRDLRNTSAASGRYTAITEAEIKDAENEPPYAELEETARSMPPLAAMPAASAGTGGGA